MTEAVTCKKNTENVLIIFIIMKFKYLSKRAVIKYFGRGAKHLIVLFMHCTYRFS